MQSVRGIIKIEKSGTIALHRQLGSGSMATVYLGEMQGDSDFGICMALRGIWRSNTNADISRDLEKWFVDEARLGGLLKHDHIANTQNHIRAREALCLVMEYVDGPSLNTLQAMLERPCILMPVPPPHTQTPKHTPSPTPSPAYARASALEPIPKPALSPTQPVTSTPTKETGSYSVGLIGCGGDDRFNIPLNILSNGHEEPHV